MSEPNQIWDGSSYGDSEERQAWEELNEACAEQGGYYAWLDRVLDPPLQLTWPAHSPAIAFSFDWVRKHLGQ